MREREVALLAKKHPQKNAELLCNSPAAVKNTLSKVCSKLGIDGKAELGDLKILKHEELKIGHYGSFIFLLSAVILRRITADFVIYSNKLTQQTSTKGEKAMETERRSGCFFYSVKPMDGYCLSIHTGRGDSILFDMTSCLATTRFADLKNEALFKSVSTDGENLIFSVPGIMPVTISVETFLELLQKRPAEGGQILQERRES